MPRLLSYATLYKKLVYVKLLQLHTDSTADVLSWKRACHSVGQRRPLINRVVVNRSPNSYTPAFYRLECLGPRPKSSYVSERPGAGSASGHLPVRQARREGGQSNHPCLNGLETKWPRNS